MGSIAAVLDTVPDVGLGSGCVAECETVLDAELGDAVVGFLSLPLLSVSHLPELETMDQLYPPEGTAESKLFDWEDLLDRSDFLEGKETVADPY